MDNIFVLVNPASANGTTRDIWPQIAAAMEAQGLIFDHQMTTAVFQAPDLVRNALKAGKTTIISVGGDGTANEVANGFFEGEKPINPQARLGIISRGTGCDLIKTLGIPKDYEGAVAVIAKNREQPMDLVLAEFQDKNGMKAQRWCWFGSHCVQSGQPYLQILGGIPLLPVRHPLVIPHI
jgi:diacylglycerol kinase family enzyme